MQGVQSRVLCPEAQHLLAQAGGVLDARCRRNVGSGEAWVSRPPINGVAVVGHGPDAESSDVADREIPLICKLLSRLA
jgi:hypothetical protein